MITRLRLKLAPSVRGLIAPLLLGLGVQAGHGEGAFRLTTTRIQLEGEVAEVPLLKADAVALTMFQLGPWIPDPQPPASYGLVLRHTTVVGTHLGIVVLGLDESPRTKTGWSYYLARQVARLGRPGAARTIGDSQSNPDIPEIIGWTTREGEVVTTPLPDEPLYVEKHVVSAGAGAEGGVAFILFGESEKVQMAEQDFRLFVARLNRL